MHAVFRGTNLERSLVHKTSQVRSSDGFKIFMIALVSLLMTGCGRVRYVDNQGDDATTQVTTANPDRSNAAALAAGERPTPAFETSQVVPRADAQHPWDGKAANSAIEPQSVPNGDAKPPEMVQHSVMSCSLDQPTRCVSCCEDYFAFGSEKWDQCVNACPQLGVASLPNEY